MIRARAAGRALAACAACACLVPAAARAEAVSGAQLRALAGRAAGDPAALAELRRADRVDGRRADLAGALRGARGRALAARLQVIAAAAPPAREGARHQAREILAQPRFTGATLPGPFRGLLDRLGAWLRSAGHVLDRLDDVLPGGRTVVWAVLAALVAAAAALVARRTLTRRVRAAGDAAAAAAPPRDDARELERRADAAEAAGDLEAALRLRFRAGLLQLDAGGAIAYRPSLSNFEVCRALRSADFDALAADFDDVVYGGRPADVDDLASSRARWPAVVSAARGKAAA